MQWTMFEHLPHLFVYSIHIGICVQQGADNIGVTPGGCNDQGCVPLSQSQSAL